MTGDNRQFELLDVLTIVSFVLQMQNQSKIFGMSELQEELHKIVGEIHGHLENQDGQIRKIMEVLNIEAEDK